MSANNVIHLVSVRSFPYRITETIGRHQLINLNQLKLILEEMIADVCLSAIYTHQIYPTPL